MMDQSADQTSLVKEALARLLANPAFGATPRQRGLLEFVVEETLAGRANRIKAFTIATSLFGRDADFDPQKSSIVRVEALRLRRILESFYAGPGSGEPLQFRLNPGSYVPQFAAGAPVPEPESETPSVEESTEPSSRVLPLPVVAKTHRPSFRPFLAGAAILTIIGATLAGAWMLAAPSPEATPLPRSTVAAAESLTPLILEPLESAADDRPASELARHLTHDIVETLSLFENPRVIEPGNESSQPGYRLGGRLSRVSEDIFALALRLTRRTQDRPVEVIWSARFDSLRTADLQGERPQVVVAVAKALAQTYGAIFADLRQQGPSDPAQVTGFGCVVMAYDTLDEPSAADFRDSRDCLKRALAADDSFASALAALAYLDIAEWQYGMSDEPEAQILTRAREMTRQAVRIAPAKGRVHAARFWARFVSERYDDALQSAQAAMELNPFASDTVARIGASKLLRGELAEGRKLLEHSAATNETRPSWQDFFLFLAAYLEGDAQEAARYANISGAERTPIGLLSQIVVAEHAGDSKKAEARRTRLKESFPGFAADPAGALDRWRMLPEIRDRLVRSAGF